MKVINRKVLEQVIAATTEPLILVRIDQPDWPVVLVNPAFESIADGDILQKPFADVIEELSDRELAMEVSEIVRSQQEASLPVESNGREYLLSLRPISLPNEESVTFYAAYWRSGAGAVTPESSEVHHALLKAKRSIRDLSRDDPVTGVLNGRAFADVFEHDWAVASREKGKVSLVMFTLEDFDAYIEIFGRHAADSCLRRVGQAIKRCLRRASDVVARPDGQRFLILSHAADEDGVRGFAGRTARAVRELGLHHPRANSTRFVSVSYDVFVAHVSTEQRQAREFLKDLLSVKPK
jgi:diguanylate cyclase (GGDEF)-like protein